MSWLMLVALTLATWRLASLLVAEDGPFHVLLKLRERTTVGGLLDCIWCVSVWIAPLALAVWLAGAGIAITVGQFGVLALAISAGAIAFDRWGA